MRAGWTGVALLGALAVQTVLSLVAPGHARLFDPFLIVVVYCGLVGGEVHGMLAGTAAGWVQDVHFSSGLVGLSGLTKCLVGFATGVGSTRFHLASPTARLLVLLLASIMDAVLVLRLGAIFDARLQELSPAGVLLRAALNAGVGLGCYELLDRRPLSEPRR